MEDKFWILMCQIHSLWESILQQPFRFEINGAILPARDYPLPVRSASKVESMNNVIVSSLFSLFCWRMLLLKVFRKFPIFAQGKGKGHEIILR